ncbi:MAG: cupin domain-containing protein [Candidatus Latescibacteria bacterium]|nr:cupin domain-containing protein [Candidatus Latescibacterota bacterium]
MSKSAIIIAFMLCSSVPLISIAEPLPYSQLDVKPLDPAKDIEIDLFISHWQESMPGYSHGSLVERDIFTRNEGDPMAPKRRGTVLTEVKRFSHAILGVNTSTIPVTLTDEQEIFYIESGSGVISSGGKTSLLYEGIGVLIPPGIEFTMTNTGDEQLSMYVIVEPIPEGFTPNREILVRDENVLPMYTSTGHWTHINKRLFRQEDGLAILVGMGPVWFDPMTMGQPHSHSEGVEEIWFSLKGDIHILLGKEMRKFPPGTAYKIPPDSKTPHSTINASNERVKTFWLMKNAKHTPEPYSQLDPNPYDPSTEPDIDMYIGHWMESSPRFTHGSLIERDVLTKCDGDPLKPPRKGAVLKYVNRFVHATLMEHHTTIPVTPTGEQELFYILTGTGILKSGEKIYELYPGITFLVPEGVEFTMTNTCDEPMTMYMVAEKAIEGFKPGNKIVIRDENTEPYHTSTAHWVNTNKWLIKKDEGLSDLELFLTVTIMPENFAQPHSHGEGVEEIWCTISGDVKFLLGKEIRDLPPGAAYMIPPDGKTPHANFNVSEKPAKFFYYGRGWNSPK